MEENKKLDGKSKQIIVGVFSVLILVTFTVVMLIAAYDMKTNENKTDTTAGINGSGNPIYTNPDNTTAFNHGNIPTSPNNTNQMNPIQIVPESTEQKDVISAEGLAEFTKTGENQISDSSKNKFIKLVMEEYDVEAEYLVAIYAVPDLGNNFVLEFDDKRDENGNIIKSPKTLKKIYHINKDKKITVATGKPTGNVGVDYGTSIMTYYLVTDVVMPEFPDYFTDVE